MLKIVKFKNEKLGKEILLPCEINNKLLVYAQPFMYGDYGRITQSNMWLYDYGVTYEFYLSSDKITGTCVVIKSSFKTDFGNITWQKLV